MGLTCLDKSFWHFQAVLISSVTSALPQAESRAFYNENMQAGGPLDDKRLEPDVLIRLANLLLPLTRSVFVHDECKRWLAQGISALRTGLTECAHLQLQASDWLTARLLMLEAYSSTGFRLR